MLQLLPCFRDIVVDGEGDPGYGATEEQLISELKAAAKAELRLAQRAITAYAEARGLTPLLRTRKRRLRKLEKEVAGVVPRHLHRGPISVVPWVMRLSREDGDALWRLEKEHKERRVLGTLTQYWSDGERGLEVSRLVELETGRCDLRYLVDHFGFLRKMGLVEFI